MYSDILVVGAGVTGCAVARVLSRYDASLTVIDRGADIAEGASKANSGIVHAGFDAKPGTLKAKLNVDGAKMYPALCEELGVPYSQPAGRAGRRFLRGRPCDRGKAGGAGRKERCSGRAPCRA